MMCGSEVSEVFFHPNPQEFLLGMAQHLQDMQTVIDSLANYA